MQNAIKSGGLIDGISSLLDLTIDNVRKAGLVNNNVAKNIKQGKNIILNNLESNISNTFSNQYKAIENTNKYILNWRNYYENKDFSGMEKEYNKIEKQLKNIAPIESTIKNARTIEVLHNLIKNNGQDFNLTEVKVLDNYLLKIVFATKEEKNFDMKNLIENNKVYFRLKNKEYFNKVKPRGETVEWENGEDVSPECLYYDSKSI